MSIASSSPCLRVMVSSLRQSHQASCIESVHIYKLHITFHQCDPGSYHTLEELKDLEEPLKNILTK